MKQMQISIRGSNNLLLLAVTLLQAKFKGVESFEEIVEMGDVDFEVHISEKQVSLNCGGVVLLSQKPADVKPFTRPMYIYNISDGYDLEMVNLTGDCNTVVILGIPNREHLATYDSFVERNFWRINLILIFPRKIFGIHDLKGLPWAQIWNKHLLVIDQQGKVIAEAKQNDCLYEEPNCLLQGVSLRVGFTNASPYFVVKNWQHYASNKIQYPTINLIGSHSRDSEMDVIDGIEGHLLKYFVSEYQMNFSLIAPEDMQYGYAKPSGMWTGKFGQLSRGEVDLIVGLVTGNYKRLHIGNYLVRLYNSKFVLTSRNPPTETSWTALLNPFSYSVWAFIFGSLIIVGIQVWWMIKLQNSNVIRYPPYMKKNKSATVPQLTQLLIDQPLVHEPVGPVSLVIASWLLFVLIFQSTYSSNLTARLSIPDKEQRVETIEDIWRLRKTLIVFKRGTVDLYLHASTDSYAKLVRKHLVRLQDNIPNYTVAVYDDNKLVSSAEKEYMKQELEAIGRNPYDYHFSKKPLIDVFCSWLTLKRLRSSPALSMAILRAEAIGLLSKWSKDPLKPQPNRTITRGSTGARSETLQIALERKEEALNVGHLKGIFMIWCIGVSISSLAFALEILTWQIMKLTFRFKYLE